MKSPKAGKKTPKTKTVVAEKSPENKPANGQAKDEKTEKNDGQAKEEKTVKKDDEKTLKVQSAGAGQAGADYNPSKKKYHPIDDAFWKHGDK